MGIRRSGGSNFFETERRANAALDRHLDDVRDIVDEAMQIGQVEMQHVIATSGVKDTVSTGGGRFGPNDRMFHAVSSKTRLNSRDRIVGRFGWLPGDIEPHFKWQEEGTRAKGEPRGNPRPDGGTGNRGIVPMMAFKQAKDKVDDYLADRLRRTR